MSCGCHHTHYGAPLLSKPIEKTSDMLCCFCTKGRAIRTWQHTSCRKTVATKTPQALEHVQSTAKIRQPLSPRLTFLLQDKSAAPDNCLLSPWPGPASALHWNPASQASSRRRGWPRDTSRHRAHSRGPDGQRSLFSLGDNSRSHPLHTHKVTTSMPFSVWC